MLTSMLDRMPHSSPEEIYEQLVQLIQKAKEALTNLRQVYQQKKTQTTEEW